MSYYKNRETIMKATFNIGTCQFHEEPNMNYQFNRVYCVFGGDFEEIRQASRKIKTLDDWKAAFLKLADTALTENRLMHAAAYYRGANFYISPDVEVSVLKRYFVKQLKRHPNWMFVGV